MSKRAKKKDNVVSKRAKKKDNVELDKDTEGKVFDFLTRKGLGRVRQTEQRMRNRKFNRKTMYIRDPVSIELFQLYNLNMVTKIDAHESDINNEHLQFLVNNCPKLSHLDLYSCLEITDLRALAECTQLSDLNLEACEITDISALAECTQLSDLCLIQCPVTDIRALAQCTQLSNLDLSGCPVTDISALARCTQLSDLYLIECPVTDISALAHCTKLSYLNLYGCPVTDIRALAQCKKLKTLNLRNTNVPDPWKRRFNNAQAFLDKEIRVQISTQFSRLRF